MTSVDRFKQLFIDKFNSGSSIIWVVSNGDDERAEQTIRRITTGKVYEADTDEHICQPNLGATFCVWDALTGPSWEPYGDDARRRSEGPTPALMQLRTYGNNTIFLFRDLAALATGSSVSALLVRRALLTLVRDGGLNDHICKSMLVIIADTPSPPPEIKDIVDVIDLPMPDAEHMRQIVDMTYASIENSIQELQTAQNKPYTPTPRDSIVEEKIVQALLGLTECEALRILAYSVRISGGIVESVVDTIADEKIKFIRKIDGLTFVPHSKIAKVEDIGGFDALKEFLRKRARAYSRHAQEIGLERPRGIFLLGIAGTGKTMCAKTVAGILGLDLVVMNIMAMLDSYVGASEKKLRAALSIISSMPNCVAVIDEIDKVFSGAHKQTGDSGVSSHLLSETLSWLSDRDMASADSNRVFVVVTANRTTNLPPEMLRAGRFDRVFGVDLPTPEERKQILAIHLRKRGLCADDYDLDAIANATNDFTGAELEEVVISARHEMFDKVMTVWENECNETPMPDAESIAPGTNELIAAAKTITPVAAVDAAAVLEIRELFKTRRAEPVSRYHLKNMQHAERKIYSNQICQN